MTHWGGVENVSSFPRNRRAGASETLTASESCPSPLGWEKGGLKFSGNREGEGRECHPKERGRDLEKRTKTEERKRLF